MKFVRLKKKCFLPVVSNLGGLKGMGYRNNNGEQPSLPVVGFLIDS